MADVPQAAVPSTEQSPVHAELIAHGDKLFTKLAKSRHIEELNWYESALMNSGKQWLKLEGTGSSRKWQQLIINTTKPVPMPVTNYLADICNTLSNSLGARMPEVIAQPNDDSDDVRMAADYAEKAVDEIDRESKMDLQNPLLAKHVTLFGTGVVKDSIDNSQETEMPQVGIDEQSLSQCADCGAQVEAGSPVCPECGSPNIETMPAMSPMLAGVQQVPQNKIVSEVKLIFSVYVPRDCKDPNLSPVVLERYRMPKDVAEDKFQREFGAETTKQDRAEFYEEALQSLGGFNYQAGNVNDMVTFTEVHSDWAELPKKLREAIENDPQPEIDAAQAKQYGLMWIQASGQVVEFKANDLNGKKRYTFYQWEKDAANPYCKAPADDIKPLQRQLNRLDSLTERIIMCGGGKWLWPKTQNGPKPTGDPSDVVEFDVIGDGKVAPQYIPATALGAWIAQKRQSILDDMQRIGRTQGVAQGNAPNGVKSFRGVAFLAEKSDEQLDTPRFLFEQAHTIRKEKVIIMAQKYWDEPRKVRVAGFNGATGSALLDGSMLGKDGDYSFDWVKGSSRKKSLDEEMQEFQLLVQGGFVDVTDSQTRDFVFDKLNVQGLNLADHLQYQKAQRDLDLLKKGIKPPESPFIKWDIPLKITSQYTLTEEFEQSAPQIQALIIQWTQYISDKLTAIKMNSMPAQGAGGVNPNQMAADAIGAMIGKNPLGGVPGKESSQDIEGAAKKEGQQVAQQVSPA
jgi:hypothetical protein